MPTVTARLDVALGGVDVAAAVSAQVALLDDLAALVAGGTPAPAEALRRLVAELPAPDLPVVGDLAAALDAALDALPGDVPAADLDGVIGGLTTAVGTELAGLLAPLVEAGNALATLARADLVCAAVPPPGTATTGGTGGSGTPPENGSQERPPQGAATAAAVAGALDGVLGSLPEPLDVPGLLAWVLERVDIPFRLPPPLPSVGDLAEPLKTVLTLGNADAAALRDHLAGTLGAVADLVATIPGVVAGLTADLEAAAGAVPNDLGALSGDVVARLHDLAAAAADGDDAAAQAAVAALDGLADSLEARVAGLRAAVLDDSGSLVAAVSGLADALDDRAALVTQALIPGDFVGPVLAGLRDALAGDATGDAIAAAVAEIDTYVAWLQDLIRALDVAEIAVPLQQASDAVGGAVSEVQQVLAGVAAGVAGALGAVAEALEAVDPATAAAVARAQLEGFLASLAGDVAEAFTPVEDALTDVADRVAAAADAFDPASLTGVVDDAVEAVAGVLEDPAVAAAVDAVAGALETATAQLEAVEFAPVTDAVVAAIDEVDALLANLDASVLPAPATLALKAALSLLPDDLSPVTDALLTDLDDLIAAGPLDLLERVRAVPADVRAQIEAFDPAALIGAELGPVFGQVRIGLDGFSPSAVLAPVEEVVAALPAELAAAVDIGALLAPLDGPTAAVRGTLASLDPAALAAPLVDALAGLVAQVRDELGVAALGDALGEVGERITDTVAALTTLRDAADRIVATLTALAGLEADVDAWVDGLFAGTVVDDGSVAAAAASVADAVAAARQEALVAAATTATAAFVTAIEAADPAARLAALLAAHRRVARTDVEALAEPARTAALAALDRLDPFDGAVAEGLADLATVERDVATGAATVVAALADWDARHLTASGPLVEATTIGADPAALLAELRDAAHASVGEPLRALLAVAGPLSAMVAGLLAPLRALLVDVGARLATVASVPGALDDVVTAVDDALDLLAEPDLGVITDALDGVLGRATAALDAVSPAALGQVLETAISEVLAAFDPGALLPSVSALTAAFDAALADLSALDPAVVLGDALGDAFAERVTPLLDRLDVSPLLDAASDRLAALPADLAVELARVNEAYQRLLGHASSLDLSVDIDIDIDLPIPSPF